MVVGACQSFRFFRQIIWFLGNNTALYEFRYQIMHYLIIKKSVRQSQFFIKHASHIKKYSYEVLTFLSFIFECFRSFESYFLYNHIAATLPFLNFCSSEWFFFWEIVQSISLFLKFLGQNFHVTPSELFINPLYQNQYDFVEVKTFEKGNNISQQPSVFLEIDNKTFLLQPPTYTLINFLSKINNEPSWYIC